MSLDQFWAVIGKQLEQAATARNAADVLRIFSQEASPYRSLPGFADDTSGAPGFFAGSGGDGSLMNALTAAGWTVVWAEASYHWAMRAPDGSGITYVEGDLYPGTGR